jgi:geranylgeranyl pyrophosphate synthase
MSWQMSSKPTAAVSRFLDEILNEELAQTAYHQTLLRFLHQEPELAARVSLKTLPLLSCAAGGGDPLAAIPVTVAWQAIHRAAKLFDDVEDGQAAHPAETINAGTGLLFVAHLALSKLPDQFVRPVHEQLSRFALRSCTGQHLDLATSATNIDPETWLDIARAKSGELLAWAAWAGALVANADEPSLAGYARYGAHLGVLLQVADDFYGVWGADGVSDLATGQLSLPVCYALSVLEEPDRTALLTLLSQAAGGDQTAEERARQHLIDLGAQGYLLVVGRLQRQEAIAALQNIEGASPERYQPLVVLLDQVLPAVGG